MKKMMKKLIAVGVCVVGLGIANITGATPVMAAPVQEVASVEDLRVDTTRVYYSDLVAGDGAVNFDVYLPTGVKLTTTNPYTFSDSVTQNYDVCLSEGVNYSKESFMINVNWANQGIKYVGDWVFNIDGAMFTDGKNRTFTIQVINDLAHVGTPKVMTNVDRGVTVQQLNQGFDLVMNIENARFNTTCFGNYIRVSMIQSSGLSIYPVAYCNSLKPNQVKMRVQATNGVEYWRTHFEFTLDRNATNSLAPINVRIPIIR